MSTPDAAAARVAVVVSHPIQHFCPQYAAWSRLDDVRLEVFFASRHGLDEYEDRNFARTVKWDSLRLDFPHQFLPGAAGRAVDVSLDEPELDRRLDEFAPAAVIVYGYAQRLQRRALRWGRAHGVPVIMIADSELRAPRPAWQRAAKALALPRLLRQVDLFLTVGDANEAYYRSYGVDDRRLVRCGFPIDTRTFDALLERRDDVRASLRAELGIPEDGIAILNVGKLVSWKRQKDIVEFSNRARAEGGNLTVILAGSGADEEWLRKSSARIGPGGVLFAGFLQPSDLMRYYAAADIYAHCSLREPHSLAISEAAYASLPIVVSSRCGSYGPMDDVRPGLNGFVYECGDVGGLTSSLLTLARQPELRDAFGRASREIAVETQRRASGPALRQALRVLGISRPRAP